MAASAAAWGKDIFTDMMEDVPQKQTTTWTPPPEDKELYKPVQPVAPPPTPVVVVTPKPVGPQPEVIVKVDPPDKPTYVSIERQPKYDDVVNWVDDHAAAVKLEQMSKTAPGPNDRFVLLYESTRAYFRAGDGESGLRTVNEIGKRFNVDVLDWKLKSLERARTNRGLKKQICNAATLVGIQTIYEVKETGRYDLLEKLAVSVRAVSFRAQDADLQAKATPLANEADALGQLFNAAHSALERLKKNPDDPAANMSKGLFMCFVRNDWNAGIPYLAKAGDPKLRELARIEQSKHDDAKAMLDLADEWWNTAAERAGMNTEQLYKERACYWYDQVVGKLDGAEKSRVEKNLKERPQRAWNEKAASATAGVTPASQG